LTSGQADTYDTQSISQDARVVQQITRDQRLYTPSIGIYCLSVEHHGANYCVVLVSGVDVADRSKYDMHGERLLPYHEQPVRVTCVCECIRQELDLWKKKCGDQEKYGMSQLLLLF